MFQVTEKSIRLLEAAEVTGLVTTEAGIGAVAVVGITGVEDNTSEEDRTRFRATPTTETSASGATAPTTTRSDLAANSSSTINNLITIDKLRVIRRSNISRSLSSSNINSSSLIFNVSHPTWPPTCPRCSCLINRIDSTNSNSNPNPSEAEEIKFSDPVRRNTTIQTSRSLLLHLRRSRAKASRGVPQRHLPVISSTARPVPRITDTLRLGQRGISTNSRKSIGARATNAWQGIGKTESFIRSR